MTRTLVLVMLGCVVATATACGKKDDSGAAPGGSGAPATPDSVTFGAGAIDAAACNALLPPALKDKIVFEKRELAVKRGRHSTTTYTVAAPKGWKQDMDAFADLKADDKGGFFSAFKVGSNCDGMCEPKDWEKIADKATFVPNMTGATVVKDVKGPGTRMLIATDTSNTKTTTVVYAWWRTGDSKYYTCVATLDESVKDAVPAFEKACSTMIVAGDD